MALWFDNTLNSNQIKTYSLLQDFMLTISSYSASIKN